MRLIATLIAALVALAAPAAAQDFPNRPIRVLHGFAAGGNADIVARIMAEEMRKTLGQSLIVEPRPGAGGNIASQATARSDADGYTIVLLTTAHAISPALVKSLNFDPVTDFQFLSMVTDFPFFIVVNEASRFRTIQDLVAEAKAKPGTVTAGTAGVGTGHHMGLELMASALDVKFIHVPYRGDSGAITGVLGNSVDFIIAPGAAVLSSIEGGKLRALAVTGPQRWPATPSVPTLSESVSPGLQMMAWIGFAAPKDTPRPVVDRLNTAIRQAVDTPDVRARLASLGGYPSTSTPEEMTRRVTEQITLWKDVAAKAGMQAQ
ncbi:Bug family tripartite tricarboxylate transporter substrate binding protein [Phreatobacter oligotrophus]|uniref:Bug family tripartite tricarboxylate transporter substrate binding protein n=1 Tax=Phreatobacter oligotrophus TaxID=1122261 RepID=UPI0023578915|nr:tripartite tricarboxylate transporter substrate binding protein [Phreatobacter oligotrophus]MBX9992195.1 tripartite tricarboxylate transporter substrate binding protein [Phreatobacter oligotrophus]